MKTSHYELPYKITDYIKEHFREDFLFEVKQVNQVQGHKNYIIEVSKDNYIHTLKFNEAGDIIREDATPAFPADIHEEPGFGDVPE